MVNDFEHVFQKGVKIGIKKHSLLTGQIARCIIIVLYIGSILVEFGLWVISAVNTAKI